MKYIIELEKIEGTDLYKAKGANTLVFDDKGIENILMPYTEHTDKSCEFCKYESLNISELPCKYCKNNYTNKFEPKQIKTVRRCETYSDVRRAVKDFDLVCDGKEDCSSCEYNRVGHGECFGIWLMEEVEVEE